ncbi:TonB-dependent receptor plug domain-containing protein [Rhodovulum steppense]|uniref:Iron complex outermembrane receptor protein n=1 Tax=Rhodovulum steppense TaxID=540251 RepID=A0A4R1YSU7_9RHOB|nr:TonB-dependent receptor [Rhodovulum steppense]TCM82713.1 iron complex outermembrane receptor protein [Rhodovulum steppense]
MSLLLRLVQTGCLVSFGFGLPALAQQSSGDPGEVFALGEIIVRSAGEASQGGTGSTVSAEEIRRTNRAALDDAVRTLPGVSVGNTGGSRNERLIFVRGFDRLQVPLYVDGIRVYLPADNRLDFGRFLTPDLSEIQIQKGYVSVLNGPGGMGGAINLVTRQPTEPFEGEARVGIEAGNRGDVTARMGYLSLGTRMDRFFVQGSYLTRDNDGFYLSRDYEPTPVQGSGLRDYSDTEDSRLNLKFGFTPNATDEYVLSYTRQTGAKNAPYNVDQPVRGITPAPLPPGASYQRDWEWPEWDLEALTFYSTTDLGGTAWLKTRFFYHQFDNVLSAYDDYTHTSQTVGRAFDSTYDDTAWGGSLEFGTDIGERNTLTAALHYRYDRHRDIQLPRPDVNTIPEPTETSRERTWSVALEDTFRLREDLSFVAGLSYDRAEVLAASRTSTAFGDPVGSSDAVNWQLAAIWTPESGGEYHASLSSRTRFPTLFERYSTRFGTAVPNPDLGSERALSAEIGYRGDIGPVAVETALFYSKVDDMIQSLSVGVGLTQNQNVGDGTYAGFEIGATTELGDNLALSANYTFLDRDITDPVRPGLKPTDTPRHSAYLRLDWQATESFSISPSLELSSSRLSNSAIQPADPTQVAYTRNAGFGLVNLDMEWKASDRASIVFGVRNALDKNYELVEGFPEAGRTFYLTTAYTF